MANGSKAKSLEKEGFILDKALCFALYNASRAMNQLYRVHLEDHDLTYPQLLALAVLWSKDNCSVGEIGDILGLDSGTLTPLLKRLEQRKLLVRKRAEEDERRLVVSLTNSGKKLQEKLKCLAGDMLVDLGMTPSEIVSLSGKIDAVTKKIEHALAARSTT